MSREWNVHIASILRTLDRGEAIGLSDAEIAAFETDYLRPGIAEVLGRPLFVAERELVNDLLEDFPALTDQQLARILRCT